MSQRCTLLEKSEYLSEIKCMFLSGFIRALFRITFFFVFIKNWLIVTLSVNWFIAVLFVSP